MRKLAALLVAAPLFALGQESTPPAAQQPQAPPAAQAPPPQPEQTPAPSPPAPAPQYAPPAPGYAPPPPQYTPPPPQQGAPPPPQYAPPPQGAPPPQYAPPPPYPPQAPPYQRPRGQRDSWYIGFGLGGGDGRVSGQGDTFSFKELHFDRSPTTVALNFKVGATLTPKLLLGFDLSGVSSAVDESGVQTSVAIVNLDAVATFFPVEKGFFVRGGLGRSGLTYTVEGGGVTAETSVNGFNVIGGVGYAFWLGRSFNLTLNLDASKQWYGSSQDSPEESSFWSFWLGCDWY
jgi:hypothetical protein